MSKSIDLLKASQIFNEMSLHIKEKLIAEAIEMNKATKFMDSTEFEEKIRHLNNWQIGEITKDMAYWQFNKNFNNSLKENEKDENIDSQEVFEQIRKKYRRN